MDTLAAPGARKLAAALSLSLAVSGCVTLGNPTSSVTQTTTVSYYPRCYEPVNYLRQSDDRLSQSVVTGAAAGAVAGGLLGALAGGDDHTGRNALIGAAVGAVAGGVGSYYMEKQRQIAEDNARFASYGSDFNNASGELDRNIASAKQAQSCYQQEYKKLLQTKRGGRMSDSEGRARLSEIVSGLDETNRLMTAVDGRIGENLDTYTRAYEEDLRSKGTTRTEVAASVRKPKARPVALKTAPSAVQTEQQAQQASAKREEGKLVVSRGNAALRDICNDPNLGDWGSSSCGSVKGV